jgi:NadR type nicotinamide-nucleotide adenylyltransferase
MEETVENTKQGLTRVILTGPECTAKTTLTVELAKRFGTTYIPEYAREYVENLKSKYTYNDVVHIALKQVELMEAASQQNIRLLFIDTYLIITKIWFKRVFGTVPDWIDAEIHKTSNDLYLLCKPDIPWKSDTVRENGGEMREILFNEYEQELRQAGIKYAIVDGSGNDRIINAMNRVKEFLSNKL